ncbi:hypothetical protein AX17_007444 [Amanita inopinata Kibby_2008]|nr:hypothetical protein AX17_007444 [Amanita inopinata Kibby_2008]
MSPAANHHREKEYLSNLIPPDLQTEQKPWRSGDALRYTLPRASDDPFSAIYERMRKYDKNMCDAWRDDIDKLLIFAGLFSATMTAFTSESYKWLQEDHTATSAHFLAQISLQLGTITNANTTIPPALPQVPFTPDPRSIRINVMWFLSLILCLSTVVLGIMCTQWLREFTNEIPLPAEQAITVCQTRHDGLLAWKVPEMVTSLPVILQISVLLFFAGILDLLWSLHYVVAAVVTAAVCLTAVILVFTTVAPFLQCVYDLIYKGVPTLTRCPYKSPQSWLLIQLSAFMVPIHSLFKRYMIRQGFYSSWWFYDHHWQVSSWTDFDCIWNIYRCRFSSQSDAITVDIEGMARAFEWVVLKLSPRQNQDVTKDLFHCLHTALPQGTSHQILCAWAKLAKIPADIMLLLDKKIGLALECDLLYVWFLKRCSISQECKLLVSELRVRCLNTLLNHLSRSNYSEFVQFIEYEGLRLGGSWVRHNTGELYCQTLMTLLMYRDFDGFAYFLREIFAKNLTHVAEHIPVTQANISVHGDVQKVCTTLLDYLESVIEDTATESFHPTIRSSALMMCQLLRPSKENRNISKLEQVKIWEKNIHEITKAPFSVTPRLVSFATKTLIPRIKQHLGELMHYTEFLEFQDLVEKHGWLLDFMSNLEGLSHASGPPSLNSPAYGTKPNDEEGTSRCLLYARELDTLQ